jgi:hypothetical protein
VKQKINEREYMSSTAPTIAELNDRFRQKGIGLGRLSLASLVQAMTIEEQATLLHIVRNFQDFKECNSDEINRVLC